MKYFGEFRRIKLLASKIYGATWDLRFTECLTYCGKMDKTTANSCNGIFRKNRYDKDYFYSNNRMSLRSTPSPFSDNGGGNTGTSQTAKWQLCSVGTQK